VDLASEHCAASAVEAESLSPLALRRLRWRMRRGLLENDLLLTAFLESRAGRVSADEIAGLDQLLDLPDQDLLELMLGRRPCGSLVLDPRALRVLDALQSIRLLQTRYGSSMITSSQAMNHV
jgi:antitoxin CptB